jgi:hypothetical protein
VLHLRDHHWQLSCANQNLDLDNILALPRILETKEDAVNLLNVLRSRREQNTHRKIAAEHAVAWCSQQIQILQKNFADDNAIRRGLFKLRVLQGELSSAIEDLSQAHRDIGTVRAMIRRKGLPVPSRRSDRTPPRSTPDWPSDSDSDVSAAASHSSPDVQG